MSKYKIAVENDLTNVSQELERNGYEITDLNEKNLQNIDAVVVSGENKNVMNMSDIKTKAQIIDAQGLSAIEVKNEIENRII